MHVIHIPRGKAAETTDVRKLAPSLQRFSRSAAGLDRISFRLDLQASFNAPLLEEETFLIGEAASDMVIVSQCLRVTQPTQHPSVAA